jgi:hypothetical protein
LRHYRADLRFRLAAFAPSLASAVLVRFGRFATVRFRFAAVAAFLMLRRAAARCFDDAMRPYILQRVDHARVGARSTMSHLPSRFYAKRAESRHLINERTASPGTPPVRWQECRARRGSHTGEPSAMVSVPRMRIPLEHRPADIAPAAARLISVSHATVELRTWATFCRSKKGVSRNVRTRISVRTAPNPADVADSR